MKKIFFLMVVAVFVAGTVLVGCKPSTKEEVESREKVQNAKENVQDAKDSLAVARKAATAEEWQTFKNQTDSLIKENEIRIAELKAKMNKTSKSLDAKHKKNIEILEQKNEDLKVKIETYKNDANADWQSFKREFNHDMDEIGHALKDLTTNNKN